MSNATEIGTDVPSWVVSMLARHYRMRLFASGMMALILVTIPGFQYDPLRWGFVAIVLGWPHLNYWIGKRQKTGLRPLFVPLLVDSFVLGVFLPAVSFRLVPSAAFVIMGSLNITTIGGWRALPHWVGLLTAGALVGGLIFGFELHLDTELLAAGLSIATAIVHVTIAGGLIFKVRGGIWDAGQAIELEQKKSQELLLKVFPEAVIPRLNAGENPIADEFADVTVLFSDIVGYTPLAERLGPKKTVMLLNQLYKRFDQIAAEHGVEKIETVGDGYLAVAGAPVRNDDHPESAAAMALAMIEAAKQVRVPNGEPVQIRIGLHTGPIFAGVIGEHRFHYAIFGETVNVASRVQSQSQPGRVLASETTFKRIRNGHQLSEFESVDLKGHGPMRTYWLMSAGSEL